MIRHDEERNHCCGDLVSRNCSDSVIRIRTGGTCWRGSMGFRFLRYVSNPSHSGS